MNPLSTQGAVNMSDPSAPDTAPEPDPEVSQADDSEGAEETATESDDSSD